jgi:hypothetical protein
LTPRLTSRTFSDGSTSGRAFGVSEEPGAFGEAADQMTLFL